MIVAKKSEAKQFERPAIGNVQAVCTAVRDIGLQKEVTKFGEKITPKIIIVWEINQTISSGELAGKRFVQSKRYTLSMYEKANLRKDIESWFGKKFADEEQACAFDLEKLIGKNCLLNLTESTDGKYINIQSISPIIAGMTKLTPELAPDHKYEWIDKIAAQAIKSDDTDEYAPPMDDERKPSDIFTAE